MKILPRFSRCAVTVLCVASLPPIVGSDIKPVFAQTRSTAAPPKPRASVSPSETGGINEETLNAMAMTNGQRRKLTILVSRMRPALQRIVGNTAMTDATKAQQIGILQEQFRILFLSMLNERQKAIFLQREQNAQTLVGDVRSAAAPVASKPTTTPARVVTPKPTAKTAVTEAGTAKNAANSTPPRRFQIVLPKGATTTSLQLTPAQDTKLKALYANLRPMLAKVLADKTVTEPQRLARFNGLRDGFFREFLTLLTPAQQQKLRAFNAAAATPPMPPRPQLRGALDSKMLADLDFQPKQIDELAKIVNDLEPKMVALTEDAKIAEADKKKRFLDYQNDFRKRFLKILTKEQRMKLDAMEKAASNPLATQQAR